MKQFPAKAVMPYLAQPDKGFRYSTDAVFLAAFASKGEARHWVDVGTGCGVLAYRLAATWPQSEGVAIERCDVAFEYSKMNLESLSVTLIRGDLRDFPWAENVFDLAVCNPPFFEPGASRQSPNTAKRNARHTLAGDIVEFAEILYKALTPSGRFCFIYPTNLVNAKLKELGRLGFFVGRKLLLKSFSHGDPHRVCIELLKEPSAISAQEMVIFDRPGFYTENAWDLLMGPSVWKEFLKNKNQSQALFHKGFGVKNKDC